MGSHLVKGFIINIETVNDHTWMLDIGLFGIKRSEHSICSKESGVASSIRVRKKRPGVLFRPLNQVSA